MYAASTLAFVPGSSFFLSDLFKWKSGSFQLSAKQGQQKLFQMKYLEAVTVPANQEFSRFENGTFYTSNPFSALKESERTPDDGLIVEIPVLPTIPIQDFDVGIFDVDGGTTLSKNKEEIDTLADMGDIAVLTLPTELASGLASDTDAESNHLEGMGNMLTELSSCPKSVRTVKCLIKRAVSTVDTPKWDLSKRKMDEVKPIPRQSEVSSVDVKREILTMTLPLLAVWLSSPMLSIIDTIVVGRTAGIAQLAALGPATAVCDTGTYFFNFLCIVATSKVANALVRQDPLAEKRGVGDGIMAATIMGALYSAILLSPLGVNFLGLFVTAGGSMMSQSFDVAIGYVRIRAIGMVFALCSAVYQSACLARHNTMLPLLSVTSAAIFNLVFDLILVVGLGKGAAGAAWASVAAQAAAFLVLARNEHQVSLTLSSKASEEEHDEGRSIQERLNSALDFLKHCASPACALAGKAAVVMMHTASASGAGAVGLAAHQCLFSVVCLFTPFGEALSQTVQSVLPQVNQESAATNSRRLTPSARKLVKALLSAAVVIGAINAFVAGSIPLFLTHIFTSDTAVAAQMTATAPLVMGILLFHALSTALEGVLFTSGDSKFLGNIYPINCAVTATVFLYARSKRASLFTLWSIMFGYNVCRVFEFAARTLYNQRESPVASSFLYREAGAKTQLGGVDKAVEDHISKVEILEGLLEPESYVKLQPMSM